MPTAKGPYELAVQNQFSTADKTSQEARVSQPTSDTPVHAQNDRSDGTSPAQDINGDATNSLKAGRMPIPDTAGSSAVGPNVPDNGPKAPYAASGIGQPTKTSTTNVGHPGGHVAHPDSRGAAHTHMIDAKHFNAARR